MSLSCSFLLKTYARAGLAKRITITATLVVALAPAVASAQELNFQFVNPSFGGNPFNSDHLLAIANAQRPSKKPTPTTTLTQGQLFAQQLQSRLLSSLSTSLVQAITGSTPGTTGSFTVGDQQIGFERTLTDITVTITDTTTGETTTITIPVLNFGNPGMTPITPTGATGSLTGAGLDTTPLTGLTEATGGQ